MWPKRRVELVASVILFFFVFFGIEKRVNRNASEKVTNHPLSAFQVGDVDPTSCGAAPEARHVLVELSLIHI